MGLTESITTYILAALSSSGGQLELQRRELAQRFGCVPSQINYVLGTRFSPEHGYIVETRRGGGGYIRITRVVMTRGNLLMHAVNIIGDSIDAASAAAIITNLYQAEAVEGKLAELTLEAAGDAALRAVPPENRDAVRAGILRQLLMRIMKLQDG